MRRTRSTLCALGLMLGCGTSDHAEPADAALDSSSSEATAPDAGASEGDAGPASCDLSGIWIARQTTESLALGVPQYASNWYYWELTQQGSELSVARHMNCGIEVRGSATVALSPEGTNAVRLHNVQNGRRGTVTQQGDGTCAVQIEPFWSVRGLSEERYVPMPRNTSAPLADIQQSLPLPTVSMPEATEDWDGDGHPGLAWHATGIVQGVRHTTQRDWTRYFTAPGYEIRAAADFRADLVIRAEFGGEEVIYPSDPGLEINQQPNAGAAHTLTMRFLGRTRDDARATALLASDDAETCARVRSALPAISSLR